MRIIVILFIFLSNVMSIQLKKLSGLKVMRAIGSLYNNPALFLSKSKLEVIDKNEDGTDVILKNVFPIPIPESTINDIELACKSYVNNNNNNNNMYLPSRSQKLQFCKSIVNKDGGFFDNFPFEDWSRNGNNNMAKRQVYSFCTGGEATSLKTNKRFNFNIISNKNDDEFSKLNSPLDVVLNEVLDCKITGLILEIEDIQENKQEQRFSIGAGIIISKLEHEDKFSLGRKGSRIPNSEDEMYQKGCVVKCTVDEVIKFALATNKRVFIPTELYQAGCIDARLCKNDDGSLSIGCDEGNIGSNSDNNNNVDNSDNDKNKSYVTSNQNNQKVKNKKTKEMGKEEKEEDKAWEIYNPRRFLRMKQTEKRAILRASGVTGRRLPRPREGEAKLNELLIELMDEAVRGEVILSGASQWIEAAMNMKMSTFSSQEELDSVTQMLSYVSTNTNTNSSISSDDNYFRVDKTVGAMIMSRRQRVLRAMGIALDNEDNGRAEELRQEFIRLTELKADPSQDEGEYSRYMDQDEWYMEQRRRAMGG